jgi:hypothetical protein
MPALKGSKPWNAGKSNGWKDKRGYKWIYVTENEKRRAKKEHRHIMEQYIGRRLKPNELVHHLNEVKDDNRIENLQIKDWASHTVEHHVGKARPEYTKRTMEVISNYREELKRLKELNSDLLEALNKICDMNYQQAKDQYGDRSKAKTWGCVKVAEAAIKKATE